MPNFQVTPLATLLGLKTLVCYYASKIVVAAIIMCTLQSHFFRVSAAVFAYMSS